jgi:hypothetical protein
MRHRRSSLIVILALLVSAVAVACAPALGQRSPTSEDPLSRRALQSADLDREGAEAIYWGSISGPEGLPGPPAPENLPLQAAGFVEAYRVGAPCTVGLSGGRQSIVYVLNTVYQFQEEGQAAAAFEQQIRFYENSGVVEDAAIVAADYDTSLASRIGVQGRAYAVRYASDGAYWETRYFLGVKANMLVFLMVDGLPDAATERLFEALGAKLIELQDG